MDTPPDAPTPGEAAELPDRVIRALLDNQTRVRTLFRRWLIVASLVLGLGVGYVAFTAHQIRSSQVANSSTNRCVARTTNNAVYDVILALVDMDPNKADYKALSDTC